MSANTIPDRVRVPRQCLSAKNEIGLGLHLLRLKWSFPEFTGEGVRLRTKEWLSQGDKTAILELCGETGRKPNEIIAAALALASTAKNIKAA